LSPSTSPSFRSVRRRRRPGPGRGGAGDRVASGLCVRIPLEGARSAVSPVGMV